jgi:hypothetical protein
MQEKIHRTNSSITHETPFNQRSGIGYAFFHILLTNYKS